MPASTYPNSLLDAPSIIYIFLNHAILLRRDLRASSWWWIPTSSIWRRLISRRHISGINCHLISIILSPSSPHLHERTWRWFSKTLHPISRRVGIRSWLMVVRIIILRYWLASRCKPLFHVSIRSASALNLPTIIHCVESWREEGGRIYPMISQRRQPLPRSQTNMPVSNQ